MEKFPKLQEWIMRFTLIVLILATLWLIMAVFGDFIDSFMTAFTAILMPFAIALFISYLLAPIFRFLEKRLWMRNRMLNTIILFTGFGFLLFLFIRYAGTLIYNQGVLFIQEDWPNVQKAIEDFFMEREGLVPVYEYLEEFMSYDIFGMIDYNVVSIFESMAHIVLTIVLVPVFLFFILNDGQKIYESMISIVPKKYRHHAIELTKRANHVTKQYFDGRFATMFIMAIVFSIILFILGFGERSILFGFMLGFFDIVPYIGPFIASILPVLYSMTDASLPFGEFAPLVTLITVIVFQIIQDNVVQPFVMGHETKIHPLLVLSAFIFFGYLWGVVGIILAIPITGMIRSTTHYIRE
ncbi:MAG: AI-2E family transporter, partial [Bacillota bacterium]